MDKRKALPSWQPRELMLQAARQPAEVFCAGFESRFALLVVLNGFESELSLGLQALDEVRQAPVDQTSRSTMNLVEFDTQMGGPPSAAPRARPSFAAQPAARPRDHIPPELLRTACFVAPIQKRAGESFLQHVSVGRARNHDIVLRHDSVSKFHAWFELNDTQQLFIKDFDSKNRTFVDGHAIVGRTEISAGQVLRFGSVESRICTPQSLWEACQL